MAYVDLNPIQATLADRLECSDHTSAQRRITAQQHHQVSTRICARNASAEEAAKRHRAAGLTASVLTPGQDFWPCPITLYLASLSHANRVLSNDEYLTLLDLSGRVLKDGKLGAVPAEFAKFLTRLNLPHERRLRKMERGRNLQGGAIGTLVALTGKAVRLGVRWVRNHGPLFGPECPAVDAVV